MILKTQFWILAFCVTFNCLIFAPVLVSANTEACEVCSCTEDPFVIDCSSRDLTIIDLHFNPNVHTINLSFNSIMEITELTFAGLPQLVELNLRNNQISVIHPDAFNHLPSLEKLDLSMNQLSNFPPTLFHSMLSLKDLSFWQNHITAVSPEAFKDLIHLEKLALGYNQLTTETLVAETFTFLQSLKSLDLSSNQFTALEPALFLPLTSLEELIMQLMNFDNLAAFNILPDGNHLISLAVSLNFDTIPSGPFLNFDELEYLNLASSSISNIEVGAFSNLRKLKTLDLMGAHFSDLKNDVFAQLPELSTLFLYLPNLVNIEQHAFAGTKLNFIYFSNTLLTEIPSDALAEVADTLEYITISYNSHLTAIHENAFPLPNVFQFILSNNEFSYIHPNAFVGMNAGRTVNIDLSHNQLTHLPANLLNPIPFVSWVNFAHNQLTDLPAGFFFGLTYFDLYLEGSTKFFSNNLFTTTPPSTYGEPEDPISCHSDCWTCHGPGRAGCDICADGSVKMEQGCVSSVHSSLSSSSSSSSSSASSSTSKQDSSEQLESNSSFNAVSSASAAEYSQSSASEASASSASAYSVRMRKSIADAESSSSAMIALANENSEDDDKGGFNTMVAAAAGGGGLLLLLLLLVIVLRRRRSAKKNLPSNNSVANPAFVSKKKGKAQEMEKNRYSSSTSLRSNSASAGSQGGSFLGLTAPMHSYDRSQAPKDPSAASQNSGEIHYMNPRAPANSSPYSDAYPEREYASIHVPSEYASMAF